MDRGRLTLPFRLYGKARTRRVGTLRPFTCNPSGLGSVLVIENLASGTAATEERRGQIRQALDNSGLDATFVEIESGIDRAIEEHCGSGCDAVVAAGGDGTLNAVAGRLAGSPIAMGIIPMGTLNHFAKDLGIPTDIRAAVEALKAGAVRRVDVAEVNGRVFLNNSSIGIYPRIVEEREEIERRGWRKWTAAVLAAINALRRPPQFRVRLEADGRVLERDTPFVFVGNNVYAATGPKLGARASLNEGTLCVFIGRKMTGLELAFAPLKALFGLLRQSQDVQVLCAREVEVAIHAAELPVSTDGEVNRMKPPLRYAIRPAALCVIAPRKTESS